MENVEMWMVWGSRNVASLSLHHLWTSLRHLYTMKDPPHLLLPPFYFSNQDSLTLQGSPGKPDQPCHSKWPQPWTDSSFNNLQLWTSWWSGSHLMERVCHQTPSSSSPSLWTSWTSGQTTPSSSSMYFNYCILTLNEQWLNYIIIFNYWIKVITDCSWDENG